MMIGWYETSHSDRYASGMVNYFLAPEIMKTVGGKKQIILRSPKPELLAGDVAQLTEFLKHQTCQRRFSALTMSFATGDVDVAAFNAGRRGAREAVNKAVSFVLEVAYLHVPEASRPPVLIGTHTHAGRLEVNLILPRIVLGGHGKYLSWNPHPTTPRSREVWDATRMYLNAQFGWADPMDPARAQLVKYPDWARKQNAEDARAGVETPLKLYQVASECAADAYRAGRVQRRDDLLALLLPIFRDCDFQLTASTKNSITLEYTGQGTLSCPMLIFRGKLFEDGAYAEIANDLAAWKTKFDPEAIAINLRALAASNATISAKKYGKSLWNIEEFDPQAVFECSKFCISRIPTIVTKTDRLKGPPSSLIFENLRALIARVSAKIRTTMATRRIAKALIRHKEHFVETANEWRKAHEAATAITHARIISAGGSDPAPGRLGRPDGKGLGQQQGRPVGTPPQRDDRRDPGVEPSRPADRGRAEEPHGAAAFYAGHGAKDHAHGATNAGTAPEPDPNEPLAWRSPRSGSRGHLICKKLSGAQDATPESFEPM